MAYLDVGFGEAEGRSGRRAQESGMMNKYTLQRSIVRHEVTESCIVDVVTPH